MGVFSLTFIEPSHYFLNQYNQCAFRVLRRLTSVGMIMEHRGLVTSFFFSSFFFFSPPRAVKMWRENGKICSHSLRLKLTCLFIRCIQCLCVYVCGYIYILKMAVAFFYPLVTSFFLFKLLFTDPSLSQPPYSQNQNKMLY